MPDPPQPDSQTMPAIDDVVQPISPDILCHLTQLISDMSQDRQDLLEYISKLERNQQLFISEMKLLKKQNAVLVHQDNLRHLASTLEARPDHQGPPAAELVHGGHADFTDQPWQLKAELVHGGQADEHLLKLSPPRILTPIPAQKTPTRNSKKDLAYITRMMKTLVRLECKYSIPVEKRKASMFTRKAKTSQIIPREFSAIFHLLCAPEPVVTVLEPYPQVDWSSLRFKPALPNPDECGVFSVSKDPDVYKMKQCSFSSSSYSIFTSNNPFGTLPGYHTTHGVVSVPSTPVQGYVYCPKAHKWMIHATSSTTPGGRWPAAGGTPGTRGKEGGRRGKQPRNHR